ncbi:hypothetical protein Taro_053395 [Colocasia esculenta]|uniref:Subtilisin-like protease n=1 Tax=Colocasia esculenta TaxID=4460 RepID=A0A843XN20_COLES|nr:hypothetical protein [Colocasia esculenta]
MVHVTLLLFFFLATVAGATAVGLEQAQGEGSPALQAYIVHMNPAHRPPSQPTHAHWIASHLRSLSIDPALHLLYNYSSLHAFAANLLPHHIPLLRSSPAVALLHPDPLLHLHTTRSPEFLGLLHPRSPSPVSSSDGFSSPLPQAATANVIVGVLDTGVWPESGSFNDAGMPQVPPRWRGACERGADFASSLCNRKLIGARSFSRGYRAAMAATAQEEGKDKPKEYPSPRDRDGHGTHTASTAAGSSVTNASLFGYATGTARGMATAARVATYKVCWSSGCLGSDILAGIDSAISDGVDVLSLSLGGSAAPYFSDNIAIATFAAAEKGVFVACSAGNAGPRAGSVANTAPWVVTVGAGTLDRDFPAYVNLGSGEKYTGVSLYSGPTTGTQMATLVYEPAADSSGRNGSASSSSNLCLPGTLDPAQVRGKVVLCDRGINSRVEKGAVVKEAGGVGMVLANTAVNGEELVADSHLLPAVAVGMAAGDLIRDYARKDPRARAVLDFGGTVLGVRPSPVVAAFSSRGPNAVAPEILKPDVVGPGVNILAAWSGSAAPTGLAKDERRSPFNILSGELLPPL